MGSIAIGSSLAVKHLEELGASGSQSRARPPRAVRRALCRATLALALALALTLALAYGGAGRNAMRGSGDVANDNRSGSNHLRLA